VNEIFWEKSACLLLSDESFMSSAKMQCTAVAVNLADSARLSASWDVQRPVRLLLVRDYQQAKMYSDLSGCC